MKPMGPISTGAVITLLWTAIMGGMLMSAVSTARMDVLGESREPRRESLWSLGYNVGLMVRRVESRVGIRVEPDTGWMPSDFKSGFQAAR